MEDEFYLQFENKYRGSRELIKERLKVYLQVLEPLKSIHGDALILDLGCGRGEWLELLQDNGWQAIGADTNTSMIEHCQAAGLHAVLQDAVDYLGSLESESVSVVTGFHIAEHLPFDRLLELVKEAHRALRPGGLLILETPNPENVVVGTASFYFDPTHVRPLPAQLLSFIPEYCGYIRTKIWRLQESPNLAASKTANLFQVLTGVSPDYAIVSQKGAQSEVLAAFGDMFESGDGLTLETLAKRYDAQQETIAQLLLTEVSGFRVELNRLVVRLEELQTERDRLRAELSATVSDRDSLQTEREGLRAELEKVYNSRSYRITAPLRAVFGWGRVQRDRINRLRNKSSVRSGGGKLIYRTYVSLKRIPLFAMLAEKTKRRFPSVWRKVAMNIKGISLEQPPVSIDFTHSEDELHFLNLFQSEIDKRKA